jgi:heme/copper-type cytochrome/quinol oxidase subunit 3
MHLSMAFFSTIIILWLNTVVFESNMGHHTPIVQKGLRLGVVLFIVSEIMFFFSLF